jgi:sarcosine oxidase subunit beta
MSREIVKSADCVVIGGGIIGMSCAYFIAKEGIRNVVVLEKGILGEGSTGRCVGGIRVQFSTEINVLFSLKSMELFENFQDEFGVDPEFHRSGYLLLASTQEELAAIEAGLSILMKLGIKVDFLSPGEIHMRWPFLNIDDIIGGTFCEREGFAGPHEVLQGFTRGCRRLDVKIYQNTKATGIGVDKGSIKYVDTKGGRIYTGCVVNAGGPFAQEIGRMAGIDIPVIPLRRQVFITGPCEDIKGHVPLILDLNKGWYTRREGGGFLISGPLDTVPSFNLNLDYDAMEEAARMAIYRIPAMEKTGIIRGWAGLYEISPDRHAILGQVEGINGFYLANGFSGHGFMHSPAVGQSISELILYGKTRSLDIDRLSLNRFSEGKLIKEYIITFK